MNRIFFRAGILLSSLFSLHLSHSQITDTLHHLPQVNVKSSLLHDFNSGSFKTYIEPVTIEQNKSNSLGELLSTNSTLYFDAYGVGSSFISARGMGSKRTPVIWNGFNIQSSLGGDLDVSLVPVFFIDNAYIESGSNSAQYGNGAAGGVAYLDNQIKDSEMGRTQILLSQGSYGKLMSGAGVTFGSNHYKSILRFYYQKANNNFPYQATYESKTDTSTIDTTQVNAAKHELGIMWNNSYRFNENQSINFHFWLQNCERHIAPTVADIAKNKTTDATQTDRSVKGTVDYNLKRNNWDILVRSGIFYNQVDYLKPITDNETNSKGTNFVLEADAKYQVNDNMALNIGQTNTFEHGKSSSYNMQTDRTRSALYAWLNYKAPVINMHITANGRYEMNEGYNDPIIWTIGIRQPIIKQISLKAKMGKSYRVPTFNDLYWVSSYAVGNPELKAESGFDAEVGINTNFTSNRFLVNLDASVFMMKMQDWMNWAPREDGIYTVMNIDSAIIKGAEAKLKVQYGSDTKNIGLNANYTLLEARDKKTENFLPNTPEHKLTTSIKGTYNSYTIDAAYQYTHLVYPKLSNLVSLPSYSLINLALFKTFKTKQMDINLGIRVNNITNENYQTRQHYPTPGRNYLVSINFNLL